ncbi:MAG: ParB/RepB/Spo0J family partition protein [Desulfobacterales bacterium]|nr:ParB/RepB/Spo0J family partition protein [Desulfobacterales bacterium]
MEPKKKIKEDEPNPRKRKKMALGKGLEALIPRVEPEKERASDFFLLDIDLIRPNRYQPRVHFSEKEMIELADSIKAQGIIQPLLVKKDESGFELIAGERRMRAAKMAGLTRAPVVLKDISDEELLEMSIVENIQRENFNPVEEAEAYHRLISEFALTQEEAATKVGKSRSAVANFLRIRQLPDQIKTSIIDGDISMGHARALLGVENTARQNMAWRTIISKALSVRETEKLIKKLKTEENKPAPPAPTTEENVLNDIADELSRHFGAKVQINRRGKKGKVQIEFYSDKDLNRLLELLKPKGPA